MDDIERFEFCSEKWVGVAGEFLQQASRGADLRGITFSLGEVLTDAPEHLALDETGRVGWYYRIHDGKVSATRGILDKADILITTDYQRILPLARVIFADNPEGAAQADETIKQLALDGKFKQETSDGGAAPPAWADDLHDYLATRTR